jgi:Peptidase family S41
MREYALVLGLALVFQATDNSTPSPIQLKAVLDSIATAIGTEYYDPKAAASWLLNEKLYESRILGAKTKLEAADEIRSALADLHNSHVFFYTHDEWALRRNVLPFTFEKRDGRVFVRTTLAPNETKFGDEITEIDGSSASTLRAKSLAKLSGVYGNPLYGQASSVAILTVVSNGKVREEQVRRIKMDDQDPIQTRELGSNVFFIRFLNLAGGAPGIAHLQATWKQATTTAAIVIDLRDCSGGWPAASSYLLDSLLGNSRKPFKDFDRNGVEVPASKTAFVPPPPFRGPVAVLVSEDTQSECEVFAAGLKETHRAVLVGDQTAGAFNGFDKSVPLPGDFAFFALPITRTVSPANVSYEGLGVAPDNPVANSVDDFRSGHDRVLQEAESLVQPHSPIVH